MEYQWFLVMMTNLIPNVTPEDYDEEDNEDGNVYAKELPVPNMEGYTFQHPATDTVFREMHDNLQMC